MQAIDNKDNNSMNELRGTVKLSYNEFQQIPYDGLGHHLISGVHIITPAPSTYHQKIVGGLFRLLSDYIEKKNLGDLLISPIDVKFSEKDGFQPDLVYIRNENINIIKNNYIDGIPDLIVEVISPGSEKIDRGWKKETAERFGVFEFWLVNPLIAEIEIYSLNEGKYEQIAHLTKDERIKSMVPGFNSLKFTLSKLFK